MKSISKRASAVLGTVVVATLSAGVASAVWTSPTGEGDASATGYDSQAADVTTSTPNGTGSPLYPDAKVTNTVTISNPNPYPIVVTDITNNGGNAKDGDCAAATVNVTTQTNASGIAQSNGTVAIPTNDEGTYNVEVTMDKFADDACQGLGFTLPVTVGSKSANF